MMRCCLISAVARARVPGCKVDTMLVLVGPQGARKSQFVAALAGDPAWYKDTPPDLHSKDRFQAVHGPWLYELAELDGVTSRADAARLKAFITSATDRFRAPFARVEEAHPRSSIFVGTTNPTQFLRDDTGSRRYHTLVCGAAIDIEGVRRDRDQLWAEAVALYERGVPWWLDPASDRARAAMAIEYQNDDPRTEKVLRWCEGRETVRVAEVATECLEIPIGACDKRLEMDIANILRGAGWQKVERRPHGKCWLPPR